MIPNIPKNATRVDAGIFDEVYTGKVSYLFMSIAVQSIFTKSMSLGKQLESMQSDFQWCSTRDKLKYHLVNCTSIRQGPGEEYIILSQVLLTKFLDKGSFS